ncbi:MAG: hypothetical protein GWO20_20160 [Candidatus Korarchaeota archaeon]|nr:hypothetical protein [Candidatus Korarchaeota archaeon]NIU85548.1 hypothetical protein [Candidatus Thorarchaeota archaeon]NIW15659.1 hypothetical protein [Candidatus Thorarchaeota archaeon]NIW53589.1 hypothetical protein [Candidatus Korarchaeota archaeon]
MNTEDMYDILKTEIVALPLVAFLSYVLFAKEYGIDGVWLTVTFTVLGIGLDLVYGVIIDVPDNFLVTWWEHYDWGFLFISISNFVPPFYPLFGTGIFLLVAELFHAFPFSYGEANFRKTTLVGSFMALLTILSFLWRFYGFSL